MLRADTLHPMRLLAAACLCILLAAGAHAAHAQDLRLGTVAFPTSARSSEAQEHFRRGVAALHSFWYPVALEEFRAAAQVEPDFMMARWGEAMAHNHPVWGDPQETDAARQVLAGIPAAPAGLTLREQGYLDAVQALYGSAEKPERDRAYAAAMERLSRDHPDDLEAAAFHALALLGIAYSTSPLDAGAPRDGTPLRLRMRAAAIAHEVWRREPNHPGAVHYLLHAFDDPAHAVLALPAARHYAAIAPAAPHALHMPSHIFLQLGMWPEAAASNEAAWKASREARMPDFHSLHWLLYAYLQQGRDSDARPLLGAVRESLAELPSDDLRSRVYGLYTQATMAATFLVETGLWQKAGDLLPPEQAAPPHAGQEGSPYRSLAALAQAPAAWGRGMAAAMTGSPEVALRHAAVLDDMRRRAAIAPIPFVAGMAPVLEIQMLEIAAVISARSGDLGAAVETMQRAAELEERMPVPPGPPPQIKPSHELFGEILLRAGRRDEAARQFATALFRHPGRAASLRGAEQASRQ
jgi:tetratricopeptide (TPR) repeat protein